MSLHQFLLQLSSYNCSHVSFTCLQCRYNNHKTKAASCSIQSMSPAISSRTIFFSFSCCSVSNRYVHASNIICSVAFYFRYTLKLKRANLGRGFVLKVMPTCNQPKSPTNLHCALGAPHPHLYYKRFAILFLKLGRAVDFDLHCLLAKPQDFVA